MSYKEESKGQCKKCGAPIIWKYIKTGAGVWKWLPFNLDDRIHFSTCPRAIKFMPGKPSLTPQERKEPKTELDVYLGITESE
jgi:hypothetical protein